MAMMYPSRFPFPDDESRWAEKQTFEAFERLPDEWTLIYSLRWAGHRKGRNGEGEADFLLLHPNFGMLVTEVKGGREILVKDGEWFSLKQGNYIHIKDPFEQAADSKFELSRWLRKELPDLPHIPFGHFVVFPSHVQNGDMSPSGRRILICDREDLKNISIRVEEIARHFSQKPALLTAEQIARIRKKLRPDIQISLSKQQVLVTARESLSHLTEQQVEIMESISESGEILVRGSAGTGKTILALNSAKRLASIGHHTLMLCYNTPLARSLKSRVEQIGGLTIDSFHGFAYKLLERCDIDHSDDELLPLLLIEAIEILNTKFDAIIIDEAQDFKAEWWEAINTLFFFPSERILHIFADSNQDIYEGSGLEQFKRFTQVNLTINCRNTLEIAGVVNKCGNIVSTVKGAHGPTPEFKSAGSASEVHNLVTAEIREWVNKMSIQPSEIALLTDSKELADNYFDTMLDSIHLLDGENGTVHVDTIHRFKGLEAEAVICVFHPSNNYSGNLDREFFKLGYIGLSRARTLLTVIGSDETTKRFQALT